MSTAILCCETMEDELNLVLKESSLDYPVTWLKAGLHNRPERLRVHILETMKACGHKKDRVLLAMGYCGGALNHLGPFDFEMIIPRADDCLSILIGSVESRQRVSQGLATYFLTEGWLRHAEDLISSFGRDQESFGRKKAERIYRIILKRYQRFGFIDTGAYDVARAMEKSLPLTRLFGLKNDCLAGNLNWLRQLVAGPWDKDSFITVSPGEKLTGKAWGWLTGETGQDN